jgi:hypothetical protein
MAMTAVKFQAILNFLQRGEIGNTRIGKLYIIIILCEMPKYSTDKQEAVRDQCTAASAYARGQ